MDWPDIRAMQAASIPTADILAAVHAAGTSIRELGPPPEDLVLRPTHPRASTPRPPRAAPVSGRVCPACGRPVEPGAAPQRRHCVRADCVRARTRAQRGTKRPRKGRTPARPRLRLVQ